MIDQEKISKIYQNMSDSSLLEFAKKNYKSLRPEVVPVLVQELQKRNIDHSFIPLNDQKYTINTISNDEILFFKNQIENLRCPICRNEENEIHCFNLRTVFSYIYGCVYTNKIELCCLNCFRKENWFYAVGTLFIGWFSINGFFLTFYSIYRNFWNFIGYKKTLGNNLEAFLLLQHKELKENINDLRNGIRVSTILANERDN